MGESSRPIQAAVSLGKWVWGVITALGFHSAIVSALSAYAISLWAMVAQQPMPVIVGLAIATFGGVLAIYVITWLYIKTLLEWPDFEQWGKLDPLRIWDAAHLWVNITPPDISIVSPRKRAYLMFRRLKTDAGLGRIDVFAKSPDQKNWLIMRAALVEYAKLNGESPRFLFATNPPASQSPQDSTHDQKRQPA